MIKISKQRGYSSIIIFICLCLISILSLSMLLVESEEKLIDQKTILSALKQTEFNKRVNDEIKSFLYINPAPTVNEFKNMNKLVNATVISKITGYDNDYINTYFLNKKISTQDSISKIHENNLLMIRLANSSFLELSFDDKLHKLYAWSINSIYVILLIFAVAILLNIMSRINN